VADRTDGDRFGKVHLAMDHVLKAESEARASIEACGVEANRILAEARRQARRVTERAHQRINRVREASDRATADRIAEIHRGAEKQQATVASETEETRLIRSAARRLAERLTAPDGYE
jgi:DNA-binding ferritin-like protein